MAKIDAELLKGLKFRTSREITRMEEGKEVKSFVPNEVPLTTENVLSHRDKGDQVIIVAADGQKHVVSKKAAEKEEKK